MKRISILVPCYNEEKNVKPMADKLTEIMQTLPQYDYEIIFRDNASKDNTLLRLREIANSDRRIKVIANARNYGVYPQKNTFKGRVTGDVVISIPCDFQEPPEKIPEFIDWWEQGYEVVAGQKIASKEGSIKYGLRQLFYRIIDGFSENDQIKNMSGIILVSRRIQELQWRRNDDIPFRYFITDLGVEIKLIQYEQQKRRSGKSSYNIWRYLSFAINSMIATSTAPLRVATVFGVVFSFLSFVVGVIYLALKLMWWDRFAAGTAPVLIGLFFLGSVQLLFIGIVGEYIGTILKRVTPQNPPIVKELINFDNEAEDPYYFEFIQKKDGEEE